MTNNNGSVLSPKIFPHRPSAMYLYFPDSHRTLWCFHPTYKNLIFSHSLMFTELVKTNLDMLTDNLYPKSALIKMELKMINKQRGYLINII